MLLLALALLALALVTWQVVVEGPLTAADWPVHRVMDPNQPSGVALATYVNVARLGQRWLTAPILLFLGAWASWRRGDVRPFLAVVVGLGTLAVVGTLLKVGIGRTPPVLGYDEVYPGLGNIVAWLAGLLSMGADPYTGPVSYPSGHAANAALTYPLIAWLLYGPNGVRPRPVALRRALWASTVPILAVGVMMVVLDYHWVSETLGGWLLGATVLLLARLTLGPGGSDPGLADRSESPQG